MIPTSIVERHKFNRERAQEHLSEAREDMPIFVAGARRDPSNVPLLLSNSLNVAHCASLVDPESDDIWRSLEIAGQACAAMYDAAFSSNLPINVTIGDGPAATYTKRPNWSLVSSYRWITGFFLNCIARQHDSIELLCKTPIDQLRALGHQEPEYHIRFVEAIQCFWNGDPQTAKKVIAALEATDPDRADIHSPDWALNIDVPILQHFFYIFGHDADFGEKIVEAVQLHKKYWKSNRERKRDWSGLLSLGLTAMAALAYDRKMPFEINSEYVPSTLYSRTR